LADTSPTTTESAVRSGMALGMRLAWFIALLFVQLLYFPINRIARGGVALATPLDALIPLWPIWAAPYLLSLAWWTGCLVWAVWKMEASRYRAFVAAVLAVTLTSYVIYLVYPTYVERPSVEGNGWQVALIRFIYGHDRAYNACPSGHTYTTVLINLFWWRWHPRKRWLWLGITAIILLSTLFTRQHNLLDLICGIALALVGYRLAMRWTARRPEGR
jgi:membrane-associated phospholipid phosphatase